MIHEIFLLFVIVDFNLVGVGKKCDDFVQCQCAQFFAKGFLGLILPLIEIRLPIFLFIILRNSFEMSVTDHSCHHGFGPNSCTTYKSKSPKNAVLRDSPRLVGQEVVKVVDLLTHSEKDNFVPHFGQSR